MKHDYTQLAQMIKERLGIDTIDNIHSLERKVESRLKELDVSVWEYIRLLKEKEAEWEILTEMVTINETYFFREEEQLNQMISLIEKLDKKHIRIWSAACSTGEEPYSIAMKLRKHFSDSKRIEITATDINNRVLELGRNGRYHKHSLSFRRMTASLLSELFTEDEVYYEVRKEYRDMVSFSSFNLVSASQWADKKDFDLIFCRNVLIYFDDQSIHDITENFYHSLSSDGFLFLGHSDPYRMIYDGFEIKRTEDTLYLKKRDANG